MNKQTLFPDNADRLYISHPPFVKALANHVFKDDKVGLVKVAAAFPETMAIPEIVLPAPRDYIMHHIPQ